jgi:Na+/H+-dicarboxylate symporter
MISRILKMSFVLTILGVAPMLFFFNLSLDGATSFKFSELLKIVLGMIPSNFFAPFVNGNPLQIIFIASTVGLAMLILGSKTTIAATMIEQSNYIVQLMMETISKFVPIFIFGSIFNMIISGSFSALMKAYKVLPLMLLGQVVVMLFYLLWVSVSKKVSPQVIMKKTFQSFIIALTTASSSAVFSSNMETCERRLGVDKRIVNFGVPLGQIIFMLGCSTMFMASALCMAEIYAVNIAPMWILTALIISVILAIAAPPIPGGALTCYTMLFVQLNIPAEAIPIIIALNVIMEFFATPCNIFTLQMELVELAGDLNMLDYNKLRKEMK